jgi:toxin ParE1/3/4
MAATVHKRARANRDLVEHYVYLAEAAGIETAERFLSSAERSRGRSLLGASLAAETKNAGRSAGAAD